MATYEQGEFKKPSKKGPIPVTDSSFNTEESWEGHDIQEVEDYICRCINKLAESSSGKIMLTICDAEGNPTSNAINFVDGYSDIRFYFKVSYMQGEEFIPSCRCIMTMNGNYIGDYDQNKYISFTEDTVFISPNIAPYLALNNNATNVLTIRAYDIDENGDPVATPGQKIISFNRVISTLALEGMTFAQVNPATIDFKAGFIPNDNSPKAYIRYRCVKPDNTAVTYTDLGTGEVSDYREVEVSNNNEIARILLSNIVANSTLSGAYTIVASLYSGRTANDEGIQSETVMYNFLYVTDDVADGTHFIIVDNVPDAIQNDYIDINYKLYVKGYDSSYKTPMLLQDSVDNAWITESIKYINNNIPYTWHYFVPSLASIGQSACSLRFAIPQMVNSAVELVNGVYTIVDDTVVYRNGQPVAITSDGKSKNVSFTPSASVVNWSSMQSDMHFNFRNKENTDYDKDIVKDGDYSLVVEDVKYNDKGSGYSPLTIDGVTSQVFKFTGNSKAVVYKGNQPLKPFYDDTVFNAVNSVGGGILSKGRTLKITFAVSNVSDPNKKIIDCYDAVSGLGFYVTGNAIYLKYNQELVSRPDEYYQVSGHNDRRFAEMKRIELCMTVQPYFITSGVESAHEVRFYINGELAGFRKLQNDVTTLSQAAANATPLVFGGTGAILYLYDVKYKEGCATPFQVLQDYCMNFDNSELLNEFFTKEFGSSANPFYSTKTDNVTGIVSTYMTIENAINYGKWLASQDVTDFAVFVTTNACNASRYTEKGGKANTKEYAQEAESLYFFRFKKDANGNGIIDDELSLYIEGHDDDEAQTWMIAENEGHLRMRRQGTSTADGTFGNLRWDTRDTCLLHRWNSSTQRFEEAYVKIGKKAELFFIPNRDAIPCFLVTAKKNVNESTHARNVPIAKWFEACSRAVAASSTSMEDILTPPQRAELKTIEAIYPDATKQENINRIKTRQVIDGITSLGFEIPYSKDAMGRYVTVLDPATTFKGQESFVGQFDLTTDKKNTKIFGFGGHTEWTKDEETDEIKTNWVSDEKQTVTLTKSLVAEEPDRKQYTLTGEDFSIEFKDHVDLCAFRTPNFKTGEADKNFEYRYPEEYTYTNDQGQKKSVETLVSDVTIGLEPNGPMHALYDLVATCDLTRETTGYYVNGEFKPSLSIPTIEKYNGVNFIDDSVDNRKRLFKNELKYYCVVNQILIYKIATLDIPLGVDQEGKNLFMSNFGAKNLKNGTLIPGDTVSVNDVVRKILRILGYDYDTNLRQDNRNNFKFLYTELYKDHFFDEFGSPFWDLIEACFEEEINAMKSILYNTLISAETVNTITGKRTNGMLWYIFDNHISHYNSTQYNLNSEANYTLKESDYPKSHGSSKEDIEWFVKGRLKFMSGIGFNPQVNANDVMSDFAKIGVFVADPSAPTTLDDANYKNMMGYYPDEHDSHSDTEANSTGIFKLDFTCYERNTVGISIGSGSLRYASAYSDVNPILDSNNLITGYNRENTSLKLPNHFTPSDDFKARLYGAGQIKTIAGLEKWYIRIIESWGELTNVEELILGSTEMLKDADGNDVPYRNTRLLNLQLGSGASMVVFGSCKRLVLAGCTAIATLDLNSFPVLEEFEGLNMSGTRQISLPVGNSMKRVHYPENLTTLTIDNKPNLEEIWFNGKEASKSDGIDNITEISVTDSSEYAAKQAINLLIQLNV